MKNLKDQVAELLDAMELSYEYKYEQDEEWDVFYSGIGMSNTDVYISLICDKKDMRLHNLSGISFTIVEEKVTAMLFKINEVNNSSFSQAHLFINDDNELIAQAAIDVPESGIIDKDIFGCFVASTAQLLNDNFDDVMLVVNGRDDSENNYLLKE